MSFAGWGLANPAGLLWCLLALPIIALHILRPRRVQARVAAVFLWRQVSKPVSAARPWQRLIPSWLLAAQVLAALLLGLLMAQPVRLTDDVVAEHTIFVVDASGSMQTLDGAPDRLATARDRALDLRRQLPEGGRASLIVAGADARALLTDSADEAAFEEALGRIEATDGTGDVAAAFALAAGLDTGDVDSQVVFISDGGIGAADVRAAPVGTIYERVGSSATNRGITQLSVEPATTGLLARISVTHFGGPPVTQSVRVDVDGVTVATETIELASGEVANLTIPIPAGEMIETFLDGADALALDNRAVATVARRPEVDVLWVGPPNRFIEAALAASPGVSVTRLDQFPADGVTAIDPVVDLVVVDGVAVPDELDLPLLAIAPTGGARAITPSGTVEAPVLTLIRSEVPLVRDLDLSGVLIAESQRVEVPPTAEVILGAEGAPLLVAVDEPAPTLYLAFDLADSSLPLELAFPVLIDRAIADLTDLITPPSRLVVGADLPIDPRLEVTITSPDLTSETIPPGSSYPRADQIGFWRLAAGDGPETLVAVGPDRAESSVAPAPDLAFEAAFEGTGDATRRGELPFRAPVIAVLLAVLGIEAVLASQRRGVGTGQWRVAMAMRMAVGLALLAALIAPTLDRRADDVATVFLIDASDSMTPRGQAAAADVVRDALAAQPDDTRSAIVVFGRDARLETLLSEDPSFAGVTVIVDRGGTDLAAAMRLGAAALPADARQRLVLISDGRATTGDANAEAERLADDDVPLDVVVIDASSGADVAVAAVDTPSQARAGEEVRIDAQIIAPADTTATVVLRRDGEEIERRAVDLTAGENTVRFTDVAASDGVLRYQVEVEAAGDGVTANDVGYGAIPVEGADRVLVIEGTGGRAAGLVGILEAAGLPVDVEPPGGVPAIDELARYASIVLVDVDRRDLSDGQVADLTAAVRDLGRGMVVIGGTRSYALGGYRGTDLEEILPVISEITDPLRRQTVAEVLAIDSSGSMGACHCDEEGNNGLGGGNRIDGGVMKTAIARAAAGRAIAALAATDEVGVLTMDANDRWVIDLQPSPPQDVIDDGLAQIVPNGPTFIDTGLLTAAEALRESDASLKHIILFSDGFTEPGNLAIMEEQAAELLAEGITVSVVATGEGAAEDLRPIAEAGGGRFYPGRNLDQLPDIIVQEAILASRDFVNEGEFFPLIASSREPALALTESPALLGYVATTAKPTAVVDLAIGPDEDPLLASWRAGLGRVSAWMSDGGERWAAPWNGWDGAPDFWAAVIKDTFPVAGDQGGVSARIVDGQLQIDLEGAEEWAADATATVRVAGPDGSSTEVTLERIDGSRFSATVPIDAAGTYALGAVVADGDDVAWSGVGLTTRSYPAEYAPRPVERGQLEALALTTGGRVDPDPGELFSRSGTVPGTRVLDLTPWLLLFAVLTWPVAVATSRLAWRRGALAVGARRASSTVAELRSRLPKMADPAQPAQPAQPTPAGPNRLVRGVRGAMAPGRPVRTWSTVRPARHRGRSGSTPRRRPSHRRPRWPARTRHATGRPTTERPPTTRGRPCRRCWPGSVAGTSDGPHRPDPGDRRR